MTMSTHGRIDGHPDEAVLNDWIDGLLPAEHEADVQSHCASCETCRQHAEQLRSLIESARHLGDLSPERDLLPGLKRRVAWQRRASWFRVGDWATAAMLLLATGWLAATWFGDREGEPTAGLAADTRDELVQAELQYVEATAALLQVLETRRDELPPEVLSSFQRDLGVIDRAIDEARAALDSAAPDASAAHHLSSLHRKKMHLLWKVARLSS